MGSEERKTEGSDGVGLFAGLLAYAIDFVDMAIGLWECRRRGCPKREKALLKKKWVGYVRRVRKIVREAVGNE